MIQHKLIPPFYRFSPDNEYERAEWLGTSLSFKEVPCPISPSISWVYAEDLSAKADLEKRGDFVWTNYGDLLVSKNVIEVFHDRNLTGFAARPVAVADGEMFLITATGWAGMASPKSKLYVANRCQACGHVEYKVRYGPERVVDPSSWDGSDMLMVWPLPKFLFVTQRFVDAVSTTGLKGFVAIPEENKVVRPSSSYSPGFLSDWMPLDLAKQRGAESGILEVAPLISRA